MSYDPSEHIKALRRIVSARRNRVEGLIAVANEHYELGELRESAQKHELVAAEARALDSVVRILRAFEEHVDSPLTTAHEIVSIQREHSGEAHLFAEHLEYLLLNTVDKD